MKNTCPTCLNVGLLDNQCPVCMRTSPTYKKKKIHFKQKTYTLKEWYLHTSTYQHFSKDSISLKGDFNDFSVGYSKHWFLENVRKHTLSGLILPSVLFLVLSLVSSCLAYLIEHKRYFTLVGFADDYAILIYFIAVVFLFLFLGLAYMVGVKKTRCIYTKVRGRGGYKLLSHFTWTSMLETFGQCEENQYYYFPKIATPRLFIRESHWRDANDYYSFLKKDNVHTYLGSTALVSLEESTASIRRSISEYFQGQIFRLAVELRSEKRVIGYIGLSKYDLSVHSCQVIYAYDDLYWGKGFASEALSAFVSYLQRMGKTLIIAGHVKENDASGKVLLKNGFKRDPARDTQMMIHGQLKDIVNYSIDERVNKAPLEAKQ